MNEYNGFPGRYRESQYALLKAMWAAGTETPPSRCAACFQTHGAIHAHHEDYSQITKFDPLCIVCHLMLHGRFRRAGVWANYRLQVARGWQSTPITQRAGMGFVQRISGRHPDDWPGDMVNEPRGETILDSYPLQRWIHPNANQFHTAETVGKSY